jgi:hypothetical protein
MVSPSPSAHRFHDFQPATLVDLSASLLKMVALAAFVFGIIFGNTGWLYFAAVSGILSITLYSYSQSGTDESWTEWISRIVFSVRESPRTPGSPETSTRRMHTPKKVTHARKKSTPPRKAFTTNVDCRFRDVPNHHDLTPVKESPLVGPTVYIPRDDQPGILEMQLDDQHDQ